MKGITELITTPDIAPGPKAKPLTNPPDITKITVATPNNSGTGVQSTKILLQPSKGEIIFVTL